MGAAAVVLVMRLIVSFAWLGGGGGGVWLFPPPQRAMTSRLLMLRLAQKGRRLAKLRIQRRNLSSIVPRNHVEKERLTVEDIDD